MYVDFLYPESERELFTDREDVLRRLFLALGDVKAGKFRGFSLFGIRRSGKTAVLKEFFYRVLGDESVDAVYIDYEGMPKDFDDMVERTLGWVLYWLLTRGAERPEAWLTVNTLALKVEDGRLRERIELFRSVKEPDVRLRIVLSILQESEKPAVVIFDEFQDFLMAAEETGVDVLGMIREVLRSKTLLVLSGSVRSILYKVSKDFKERFFLQLDAIELPPFSFRDTWRLAEKVLGRGLSGRFVARVFRYTGGFPFYITALMERVRELSRAFGTEPEDVLELAYFKEAFSAEGKIYEHCRYLWSDYTSYARRKKYLRKILEVLSEGGPMTVAELSKAMGVDYGVVYKYVEELELLGLVRREGRLVEIFNRAFASWILMRREMPEISRIGPRERLLIDRLRELERRVARAEKLASRAFESFAQMVVASLLGRKIDARKLGLTDLGEVVVPGRMTFNPVRKVGGKVYEVDAILEDGSRWVVEITISRVDARYIEETKEVWRADVYWFISYEGFAKSALELEKSDIILTTQKDLELLMKLYL